jgi:hypothetical protein
MQQRRRRRRREAGKRKLAQKFLKRLKIEISDDHVIPLLGICPKE